MSRRRGQQQLEWRPSDGDGFPKQDLLPLTLSIHPTHPLLLLLLLLSSLAFPPHLLLLLLPRQLASLRLSKLSFGQSKGEAKRANETTNEAAAVFGRSCAWLPSPGGVLPPFSLSLSLRASSGHSTALQRQAKDVVESPLEPVSQSIYPSTLRQQPTNKLIMRSSPAT